jgi:Tol biopolymer transport system component
MVWVDRQGRVTPFSEDRGTFWFPDLASSGKRVAVAKSSADGADIWIYDTERGTRTRLTADGSSVIPVWTRDESRVAFMSDGNIFEISSDGGGNAEAVLVRDGNQNPSSYTHDDRALLFQYNLPETGVDIWMIADGGEPAPILATPFDERAPVISPDGEWMAYVSNETGRNEVYVQPYPALDKKWAISGEGGTEPVWSADGSELFYRRDNKMIAVAVDLDPTFDIRDEEVLFEGDFDGNAVSCIPAYDVSPDGQRFLMIQRDESSTPRHINVVLNWSEELKR